MQGQMMIVAAMVVVMLSLSSAAVGAHGHRSRRFVRSYDEPCKKMRLYFHDILYGYSHSTANSTSSVVAKPTALLQAMNSSIFGTMVVFNGPMTEGNALPPSLEETTVRAQGLYLYDKEAYNAWFAFSVVFNSTVHRSTINLVGADIIAEKTRDISVVGGTGDFFMACSVATLRTDEVKADTGSTEQALAYFRLQKDIKFYECYV